MAKGKYKQRKRNHDAAQLTKELTLVRAQLAAEQARLIEMQERATLDAELRSRLRAAVTARDAVCRPQLSRIADDRHAIRAATRQLEETTRGLDRHWDPIAGWGWTLLGPESFYALLSGNRAYVSDGVVSTRLSVDQAQSIQRARGFRKDASQDFTPEQKMVLARTLAYATGTELPGEVTDVDGPAWDAYMAEVGKDSAAVIAFQSPPSWLDTTPAGKHPVSQLLGASPQITAGTVDAPAAVPSLTELSTGSAALRDSATAAGASAVADAFVDALQRNVDAAARSQIRSLIAAGTPYPAPADAASLHAWYAVSALGAWGRHRGEAHGRIAVAAACAVPFWLPPGHTLAYLDSEPLSGEDVDEMRMPFAQVMVTFAEPARLPATDSAVLRDDPRMRWIDYLAGTREGLPDSREITIAGTNNLQSELPTMWDAIAGRGAHVEAVLLLADAHGRLDDLFGWCITIPSTTPGSTLGRWVIPASRSTTHYPNLITNAAAAAAWSEWHRPGHSRGTSEQQAGPTSGKSNRSTQTEDTVHVLNVTATSPSDSELTAKGEPTGRSTAPHRRRGHWRRQHFGPGRTQTRRIRIAPVMVNAGQLGSDRPQVYRLPAPKSTHSGSATS